MKSTFGGDKMRSIACAMISLICWYIGFHSNDNYEVLRFILVIVAFVALIMSFIFMILGL